jgi:hypothetical protein
MRAFGDASRDVDLLAYGYASDRLLVEREIQNILYEFSNNNKCNSMFPFKIDYQFAGSITSTEYFIFDTITACNVIVLFDMLCNSVKIGSDDPVYGINPNSVPIGYGEELQKFYNSMIGKHVAYPTEFTPNGFPLFKDLDESDKMPYCKPWVEYKAPVSNIY